MPQKITLEELITAREVAQVTRLALSTIYRKVHEGTIPPEVASNDGLELVEYPGTLTVGGELDKLASNVVMGRVLAGVHW